MISGPNKLKLLFGILAVVVLLAGCSASEKSAATDGDATKEDVPYSIVRRISVSELQDALNRGSALVVDVRNAEEYHARAIKGAYFVDQLLNDPQMTARAQDKLVVTYCACPQEITSARVAFDLEQRGYKNVAALLGGYEAWDDARLPTEPGQMDRSPQSTKGPLKQSRM